VDNEIME